MRRTATKYGLLTLKGRTLSEVPTAELELHPSLRRLTPRYLQKKRLARTIWIGSLLLMIPLSLGAQLALAIATTFVGFIILDETN